MSLQARLSKDDPRLYNANRDLAHCMATVLKELAQRVDDGRWDVAEEYMAEMDVTPEDLGRANEAYIAFLATSCDHPKERMQDVMARVGWFEVPGPAQLAYMGYLGTVVSGIAFAGVREATLGGEGPVLSLKDLQEAGRESSRLMTYPRWKRKWMRLIDRVRRAFNALRNK